MELYSQLTSSLNDLFASQLTESVQWRTVPGQLTKVSSSPAGYTWGLNVLNSLYVCKEPCSGQWRQMPSPPDGGRILDIAADSEVVNVLIQENGAPVLRRMLVHGSGNWSKALNVPTDTTGIVATADTIFADTPRGGFTCKSPCVMPDWKPLATETAMLEGGRPVNGKSTLTAIFNPKAPKVRLTSASSKTAYGIDEDQRAVAYINGLWKSVRGLAGYTVSSVAGESDTISIYATTTDGRILRCQAPCSDPEDVRVVDADGHSPDPDKTKQVSVNPESRQVWALSPARGFGEGGYGIFNRTDGSPRNLAETISPMDRQRNDAIDELNARYERALAAAETGKMLEQTTTEVRSVRPKMSPTEDPRVMRRMLDFEKIGTPMFLLQIACATVFVVLVIYTIVPSPFNHPIAFVIACVGAAIALSFSSSKG